MPAGPAPVGTAAVAGGDGRSRALTTYDTVTNELRTNRTEVAAIRAMFDGDADLMKRFLAVAFSALANNSDVLSRASPTSIIQSIRDAASLGLEPTGIGGDGAIIVYDGVAQFQPMWRGYLKRIRNSGKVLDIDCQLVYMADEFAISLGTDPRIHHVPALPQVGWADPTSPRPEDEQASDRGGYRGCYAWALMPSGKYIIEWLTVDDINAIRDQYGRKTTGSGRPLPWQTAWGEMARKTVIRRLAKRLPGSATDQLLAVEAKSDAAEEALRVATARFQEETGSLRELAMRATKQLPSPPETVQEPPADPEEGGASASTPEPVVPPSGSPGAAFTPGVPSDAHAPDPGDDPNVAAAIATAEANRRR